MIRRSEIAYIIRAKIEVSKIEILKYCRKMSYVYILIKEGIEKITLNLILVDCSCSNGKYLEHTHTHTMCVPYRGSTGA